MLYPFILTTLAGLATMIGTLPIFVKIKNTNSLIGSSCAFASGVMICISIFDLIPESINYLKDNFDTYILILVTFLSITIGINVSWNLDKAIDKINNKTNLYKVGILSMIAIILHNIPEGILSFIVSKQNLVLGVSLCIAIALHNIPEGISIAIPIYYSTNSKAKAILYTFISAISELFGAIITYFILEKYINKLILGLLFGFIAGIMLQISFNKLLPTGYEYDKKKSIIFIIIGFIFMSISLILNNLFT